MKLDYGDLLSPIPIKLSIGTVKHPTLKEIFQLSYEKFVFFEFFLKMNPELFFQELGDESQKTYWNGLSDMEKEKITLFMLIIAEKNLQQIYSEVLNFFFLETVIYNEENNCFIITNENNEICGMIIPENFNEIIYILQQICCIQSDESNDKSKMKFKNSMAQKIYEKIHSAEIEKQKNKKIDWNNTLPNIISAVANVHPSLNCFNIWDLTLFQLMDSFYRLKADRYYQIESTRVSVWGDEKNTFDSTIWYKNRQDGSDKNT